MSLDAIGIACRDIEKSILFYKLLGLEIKEVGEGHWDAFWGQRYSSVKDPNGNLVDIFASL